MILSSKRISFPLPVTPIFLTNSFGICVSLDVLVTILVVVAVVTLLVVEFVITAGKRFQP